MTTLSDKLAAASTSRTVSIFTVPPTIAGGVQTVGIAELTAEEELMATKRARGDAFRLAYELAKQSLVEVDGEQVKVEDGSADAVWSKMNPQLRNLVLAAYSEVHTPPEESATSFLKSRTTRVG